MMNENSREQDIVRRKVIGLGEDSLSKSYYPQLQQHIHQLEDQKKALEEKTEELNKTIKDLQYTQSLLEENEHRFRTLFESASDAIFIFDSTDKCVDCNSKGLELLDFNSKDELIATSPIDIAPKYQPNGILSREMGLDKLNKAWNGESQFFEWIINTKNSTETHCMVSLSRIKIKETHLLQATVKDITQFKKLEHAIRMATIRTEEKERLRFSKELHDGIGPILSTIKLYLQWLDDTDNEEHINIIKKKINNSIIEATKALKEVSHNLSPHVLSNYGLIEALHIFINRIHDTGQLTIALDHNFTKRLHADLEVMFYRVATELINNTIKHAEATAVSIQFTQENDILYFLYTDNGKGFDINCQTNGMGINNIKNRVKSVGGSIELNSNTIDGGFNVQIVITNNTLF